VHDPQILILDEPTAGADLALRHHIWNYLRELNAAGKTIFLTTHYMEEAERLAKSVVIIDKGHIVHRGDKQTLLRDESLEKVFLRLTREEEDAH
jgi:ABC-2 type transport system ATP-binding protein